MTVPDTRALFDLTGRAAGDPSLNKAGAALEQILANSGFLSRPAELLEGGYGLPQQKEWQRLEISSRERQQQLRQLSDELDDEVRNAGIDARACPRSWPTGDHCQPGTTWADRHRPESSEWPLGGHQSTVHRTGTLWHAS